MRSTRSWKGAWHRILFRCGDKEHLITVANRYTLAGLTCVGVAMLGSLIFVGAFLFPDAVAAATGAVAGLAMLWSWWIAPVRRRLKVRAGLTGRKSDRVVPLR
jgi:hypothetical protein